MPRSKSKPPARSRTKRLILTNLLIVACLGIALIAGYLLYLNHVITSTFDGRRWSVPARVYAQPLELYPGLAIEADEIAVELKRLGYRRGPSNTPGSYMQTGNEVRATLRAFTFGDGPRVPTDIRVRIADHAIDTLYENGEPASLVRLEPPLIGSFFASHGEDRLIITPEETPALLSEGLKAVEDRNFDTHAGFDLKGIARAAIADLRAGDLSQGGSTLTQQLVKSYFLDNRRTAVAQAQGSCDGGDSRRALSESRSVERVYQRDLSRPGRRTRGARLRSRQPVLFQQTVVGTRPGRDCAADRGDPRPFVLQPVRASRTRAFAARSRVGADERVRADYRRTAFESDSPAAGAHPNGTTRRRLLSGVSRSGARAARARLRRQRTRVARFSRVHDAGAPCAGRRPTGGGRHARPHRDRSQAHARGSRSRRAGGEQPDRRDLRGGGWTQSRLSRLQSRVERAPAGRLAC